MPRDHPARPRGPRHRRIPPEHRDREHGTSRQAEDVIDVPDTLLRRSSRRIKLDEAVILARTPGGRVLVSAVALIALLTVIGLVALWPRQTDRTPAAGTQTQGATIVAVTDKDCPGASGGEDPQQCRTITIEPAGERPASDIVVGPASGAARFAPGDRVRVAKIPAQTQAAAELAGVPGEEYSLVGADRTRELLIVGALLGLLALVALRGRGALALLGVGLSIFLLVGFLVPAILAGRPPLLVALVGALAVMFVTLVLTNGLGAQTLAGVLGISFTLVFTTVVGLIGVRFTGLDGTGSELSTVLAQAGPGVSLEGILLAGMVIGGLGVLADTAVTQASAVMALRRADGRLGARALYAHGVVVGRDHLSATIHTLVLAYAGTVLPLLLVLHAGATTTADTLNQVDIAEPVLATIVGCAGLIVAVPLTTALAAALVARIPASALPEGDGHHH